MLIKKIKFYKKQIIKIYNFIKLHTNIKDIQINISINWGKEFKIKNLNIENYNIQNIKLINIKIFYKYKKCEFICNNFKEKTLLKFVKYIKNTIKFISKDKHNLLCNKKQFCKKYNKNLGIIFFDNIKTSNIINLCKNIENNILNFNKNIIFSDGIIFIKNTILKIIYNKYKFIKYYINQNYILISNIFTKKNNYINYNTKYLQYHKLSDLIHNINLFPLNTYKEIIFKNKCKDKTLKTKKYNIIFNNITSSELFKYLYLSLKGKNIYNKISFMYKLLNKYILPKWINIIEDPHYYKGIGSKPFDNEGLNTKKYILVKKGILKTWILNKKYSKKLNIKNTFNSGGLHNWCFKNLNTSITLNKLIKKLNNGILIDNLIGQGVNINNGNFSKGASGFIINKGKITNTINKITISGNLKNLFINIKNMSNDINTNSKIRCGSILVPNIQIACN